MWIHVYTALRSRPLMVAVALVVALGGRSAEALTQFQDGDFDPSNWTFLEVASLDGGAAASEAIADGNPGAALRVTTDINQGMGQIWGLWFWHVTYDPAVSGAIGSFDYAEDARGVVFDGRNQATGFALRQAGKVFVVLIDSIQSTEWHTLGETGIVGEDFGGLIGRAPPDLSATGAPIEVGFYRSVSHRVGSVGPAGSHTADIDNWSVTVRPPCASDADCADPATCSEGTCLSGVCQATTDGCDDGLVCTVDVCDGGKCGHELLTDFATVDALLAALLARVEASPCAGEEVVKKVGRKLTKRVTKARKRLAKAGATTKDRRIIKLIAKTQRLLVKARTFIVKATERGLVSAECGAELTALIDEIVSCLGGLPLPG